MADFMTAHELESWTKTLDQYADSAVIPEIREKIRELISNHIDSQFYTGTGHVSRDACTCPVAVAVRHLSARLAAHLALEREMCIFEDDLVGRAC